jgi:hypothetical protein
MTGASEGREVLSMHADHHVASKAMLATCPACHEAVEAVDRVTVRSAGSPAAHAKVRCRRGHWYTVLVAEEPTS